MSTKRTMAIDPGERFLRAVLVRHERGGVTVARAIAAPLPSDVDPADAEAMGRFVSETLRRSGFGSGGAIVTLDREQATVRRMDLPTVDDAEFPDMARLAVQRETPPEAGTLVTDLLPRERSATSTTALVTAAPQRSIDQIQTLVRQAACDPSMVSLRVFGASRLLAEQASEGRAVLGLDCTGEGIELVVVRDGEIRYTRGVRLAATDAAGTGEALASEAKRSWMSYRFSQPDDTIGTVIVFGTEASRTALAPLEKVFGAPLVAYQPSDAITIGSEVDRQALAECWPLVGLLLEDGNGEETINLAAPRKAPDLAARRRQRVLAGAGVLVLAALLGWTLGNKARQNLAADVEDLKERATNKLPDHFRFKRDTLRLQHLKTWESVKPEWLEHLRFFHGFAQDSSAVVLESWNATLEASDVRYDRREKDKEKRWSVVKDVKISVEGEAKDRTVADALRDALVDDARYTLTSTGADTQGGHRLASPFSYVLRSNDPRSPNDRSRPEAKGGKPDAAKAGAEPAKAGGGS